MKTLPSALFVALIVTAALPPPEVAGQDATGFKPGQSILYLEGTTGEWKKGTYVRPTSDGSQPIIKEAPNQFYKDGFERATSWDRIKDANAAAPAAPKKPAAPAVGQFQAGEAILYLDGVTQQWKQATYIGQTADGTQPIIREAPNEFYKDGFERATSWDRIKKAGAANDNPPAAAAMQKPPPDAPVVPPVKGRVNAPAAPGGKPLTQDEVLNFLTARVGDNPFADSQKLQQAKLELAELIKKRGTDFRFDASSPFANQLSKFGMTSDVTGPLNKNFGEPNQQDVLFGTWTTTKTGLPVKFVEGGKLYTWTEAAAINTGTVTVNPDGSYLWKTGTAQGDIAGQWRPATAADMLDSGGAGVVLKNAKNGTEWVVYKYREWDTQDDWISIVQLPERGVREGGVRIPAGQENKIQAPTR